MDGLQEVMKANIDEMPESGMKEEGKGSDEGDNSNVLGPLRTHLRHHRKMFCRYRESMRIWFDKS